MSDSPLTDAQRALERLALAEWPEAAEAHVDAVTVVGHRAEVALTVGGHYEYWIYFQRDEDGQWWEFMSANGRSIGWEKEQPDNRS